MKVLLVIVALTYLGSCLALYTMQRDLLYIPAPVEGKPEAMEMSVEVDSETLQGWVVNEGQPKALIYYGGNSENIANNITFFEEELSDYTVYLIPYRGYGNSTGEPTEQGLYQDALYVFDKVKGNHTTVSLIGRSLGSGVATYVAAQREVEKLVLITPFDSVENVAKERYWMFPVSYLIKDKFLSLSRVKNITAKTYIFIAETDKVVSHDRTNNLIEQFSKQLMKTSVIAKAEHNTITNSPQYITELKQALNES